MNWSLVLNYAILLTWGAALVYCAWRLSKLSLSASTRALWALILLAFPIVGALVFLIVNSNKPSVQ
ncbi:MAG: PLDc N-terminal domain-containing protein [Anaerolineales bacterium]|nr:PLDc N-terminal domain-containing protein [Anaerolineales bacterium]